MSKRPIDALEDDSRPSKKQKFEQIACFPEKYRMESNTLLVDFHPEPGDTMDGGHIKATVAHRFKYWSRGRVGLVLRLPECSLLLECVIPLNEHIEVELPAITDTIQIALIEPEFVPVEKQGQFSFRLEFSNTFIIIESSKEPGLFRKLIYMREPDTLEAPAAIAPSPISNEQMNAISVAMEATTTRDGPTQGLPIQEQQLSVDEQSKPTKKQQAQHRIRKRDTRYERAKSGSTKSNQSSEAPTDRPGTKVNLHATHKQARKMAKASSRAQTNESIKEMAVSNAVSEKDEMQVDQGLRAGGGAMPEDNPERPEEHKLPETIDKALLQPAVEIPFAAGNDSPSLPSKTATAKTHVYQIGEINGEIDPDKRDSCNPNVALGLDGNSFIPNTTFRTLAALENVRAGDVADFIGAVINITEPRLTARGDAHLDVFLCDPTRPKNPFKVRLFCRKKEWLPEVLIGQFLLLWCIKMDDFGGERMGTGICDKWKWLGYDPESHSEFFNNQHGQSYVTLYKAGSGELQYFERLTGWYQTEKPVTVSHRRKHVLLSQLVDQGQFFNATVEVLYVEVADSSVTIYVTDYSRNEYFQDDESHNPRWEPVRWKRTLRIDITPRNECFEVARNVQARRFYRLKNVRYQTHGVADMPYNASFEMLGANPNDSDYLTLLERKKSFIPDSRSRPAAIIGPNVPRGNPRTQKEVNLQLEPELLSVLTDEYLTKEQIRYRQDAPFLTFDELSKIDQPGNQFNLRVRIVDILPADLRHILCLICQQCGERLYASRLCPKCKNERRLKVDIMLCLLVVDDDGDFLPVIIQGDNAKYLFDLEEMDTAPEKVETEAVLKTILRKLRNVVGNLWTIPPVEERFKKGETFDIEVLVNAVDSPWINLTVLNWQVFDEMESRWVQKYSVTDCKFE